MEILIRNIQKKLIIGNSIKKRDYEMISSLAVIETYAENIGNNVEIEEFAIIRKDVIIGNDVVIHPYVFINEGVVIGDGVEIFPGAVIGKEPKGIKSIMREPKFNKHVYIGANCSIGPHVIIYYDVEIGQSTLIGDGTSIREQCRIGSYCIFSRYITVNYNTVIGDRVKVIDLTHVTGNAIIGNDVFISLCVGMANDNSMGKLGYTDDMKGPTIEDGAVIGVGVSLLPGVVIGKNARVGAGSLVTKNVESETLVMGVPARFVKRIGGGQ
jgi:UDP-3-O-[3-hydroxymyristoyl] glucosamine N-acyltransferase